MASHVLYLHATSHLGGAQISILTLMRYLDPDRYLARILLSDEGPFLDLAHSYGVNADVQGFPSFSKRRPWVYVRSLSHLIRIIRTEHIDLVHMNCLHTLLYASRTCRLLRIPYVFHVRDARQPWFGPRALNAVNESQAVIANSAHIASICRNKGVSPTLLNTVYNPVEAKRFSEAEVRAGSQLRSSMGIPSSAVVFGFVGRLHPIKGPDLFIEAAAEVLGNLSSAHFIIAGEARPRDYARELRSLLDSKVLASRVHFLGFHPEVPSLMRALDVLVVPSRDEPFGRVAVEGMASGCPVIVSRVGGLVEIVTHGLDGLVTPPDDVAALGAAMLRLAQDPQLRSRLAREGRRTARRFNAPTHAHQIQAIYDEILKGARA